jgi:hypothetical protein
MLQFFTIYFFVSMVSFLKINERKKKVFIPFGKSWAKYNEKRLKVIYQWRKVLVCLFEFVLFVVMRSTSDHVLGLFGNVSWGGVHWLGFMVFGRLVQKFLEYWMISSLKIKLNLSWFCFGKNWNVPLVFLERSWWAGFNGIYLVRFGFRMWEILI